MQVFSLFWTQNGYTPLHVAAANGHIDVCSILLDCGVDVNAQDTVIIIYIIKNTLL